MDIDDMEVDEPELISLDDIKKFQPDDTKIIIEETQLSKPFTKIIDQRRCTKKSADDSKDQQNQASLIRKFHGLKRDEEVINNSLNQSIKGMPPNKCIICDSLFLGNFKLKMHYIHHHEVAACEICDLLFENANTLLEHDKQSNPVCEYCQEHVENEDLQKHYNTHDVIECPYCSFLIRPKSYFKEHLKTKHHTTDSFECGMSICEKLEKLTKFQCNLCNTKRKKEVIFSHLAYYHRVNVYYIKRLFNTNKMNLHLENVNDGVEKICKDSEIFCDICQNPYTVDIPKIIHDVYCSSKYFCRFCSKTFLEIQDLNAHIDEKHKLKCLKCDSCHKTSDNLKLHYKDEHNLTHCFYCGDLVSNIDDNFNIHVKETHNTSLTVEFENLITVIDEEQKIAECILCEEDLSLKIHIHKDIFDHFRQKHKMTLNLILQSIGTNPFKISLLSIKKEEVTEEITIEVNEIQDLKQEVEEESLKDDDYSNTYKLHFERIVDPSDIKIVLNLTSVLKDTNQIICMFCKASFVTKLKFLCHLLEVHRCIFDDKYFKCEKCVGNKINMEEHLNLHFFGGQNEGQQFSSNSKQFETSNCICRCRFCDEVLNSVKLYIEHEKVHYNDATSTEFFKCSICSELYGSEGTFYKHVILSNKCSAFSNLTYLCNQCKIAYPTPETLQEHYESTHEDDMMYLCPNTNCKKLFSKKRYVVKHVKRHVKVPQVKIDKVYKCDLCDEVCNSQNLLSWHVKCSHGTNNICKICDEKFKTPKERKLHYRQKHAGESLFKCKLCEKGFFSNHGLSSHMRTHEDFSATCSYCGKEYNNANSYKAHLQIHIGPKHQCPYCSKLFAQKANLRKHIRLHTGETPYACKVCERKFSDKSHLASHERTHESGERTCHCECGKSYKHRKYLLFHIKTAHNRKRLGLEQVFLEVDEADKSNMYSENSTETVNEDNLT